jgi:hypothetical protein
VQAAFPPLLQVLDLEASGLTNKGMQSLSVLLQLHTLTLSQCRNITAEGLQWLVALPTLRELFMCECTKVLPFPNDHLPPGLQVLDLSGTCVFKIGEGRQPSRFALQTINYTGSLVTDGYLELLVKDQKSVHNLNLAFNQTITDFGVACLGGMAALQTLDLSGCNRITEAAIRIIAKLVDLRTLRLRGCNAIDDQCMSTVSEMVNLQSLAVSRCGLITDTGMSHLQPPRMPNLRELDVSDCPDVTRSGLRKFAPSMAVKFGLTIRGGCRAPIWNVVGDLPDKPQVRDLHTRAEATLPAWHAWPNRPVA